MNIDKTIPKYKLQQMSVAQLTALASQYGLLVNPKASKATIIESLGQYYSMQSQRQVFPDPAPDDDAPGKAPHSSLPEGAVVIGKRRDGTYIYYIPCTEQMVRDACKSYFDKPGFIATFDNEEKTWHFKYRGLEDSGTLDQDIKNIVSRAQNVARGARRMANAPGEWDHVPGNNYANRVLLGGL